MTTIEEYIDAIEDSLSRMSDATNHADEWNTINDLHQSLCEFRAQMADLRQRQQRNTNMKG